MYTSGVSTIRRRAFLTTLVGVVIAGCTGPIGGSSEPSVSLGGELDTEPTEDNQPVYEVRDGGNVVVVGGIAYLPTPCDELKVAKTTFDPQAGTLDVKLAAKKMSKSNETSIQVIERRPYALRIENAADVQLITVVGSGTDHEVNFTAN